MKRQVKPNETSAVTDVTDHFVITVTRARACTGGKTYTNNTSHPSQRRSLVRVLRVVALTGIDPRKGDHL